MLGIVAGLSCGEAPSSSISGGAAGASAGHPAMPAVAGAISGAGTGGSDHVSLEPTSGSGGQAAVTGGTGRNAGEVSVAGDAGSAGSAGSAPLDDRCELANLDASKPPQLLNLTGNLGVHDPMILSAAGKLYLFATGNDIAAKTSSDLSAWQGAPDVFDKGARPDWLAQQVPGVSNLWAPDASFFGGQYHLYYSASTFGSNHSCIGHLTRMSMTSGSWTDRGAVICSNAGTKDDFNAIDPNVVLDLDGTPWLVFGSFWSGIKLIKLDQQGARDGTSLAALASRPSNGGALEAPFMVRRCGYFYLFVSWDKCCQGVNSTYNIRVGRSESVQGPFADKDGKAMLQGGGSLVLAGDRRYHGPGHNAVLFTPRGSYNVYHSYDANNNGASVLRIAELAWDARGWPVSAGP